MDPMEALRCLDEAMADGSRCREDVFEYADALIGWLKGGGFMPCIEETDWRFMLSKPNFIRYLQDLRTVASMD